MVAVGLAFVAVGLLLVRLGWAGRRGVAVAGWAAAVAGLALLTVRDGAWGLAISIVAGMAVALVAVLQAGWVSSAKATRSPREAPAILLPRRWRDLARRIAVFLLVVPAAFAAAQWLAFGAQALARRGGAGEADAIVLALLLQPVLWGLLMAWQMTRSGPGRMVAPPLAAALLGTILWAAS